MMDGALKQNIVAEPDNMTEPGVSPVFCQKRSCQDADRYGKQDRKKHDKNAPHDRVEKSAVASGAGVLMVKIAGESERTPSATSFRRIAASTPIETITAR